MFTLFKIFIQYFDQDIDVHTSIRIRFALMLSNLITVLTDFEKNMRTCIQRLILNYKQL